MVTTAVRPGSKTLDANWTLDDLLAMPEDDNLYEIIDGELYVMTTPVPVHQRLSMRLSVVFYQAGEATGLGRVYASPIRVRLSERDIVQPDLLFIERDQLAIETNDLIDGPPDIVVEIVSPSTRSKDRNDKATLYARAGVREYWQVDPRHRSVVVLTLTDGAYEPRPSDDGVARSAVLPGLVVDLAALFADLT